MNTVELIRDDVTIETKLIPIETIQEGFMGLQVYEGVEPVDND